MYNREESKAFSSFLKEPHFVFYWNVGIKVAVQLFFTTTINCLERLRESDGSTLQVKQLYHYQQLVFRETISLVNIIEWWMAIVALNVLMHCILIPS